MGVLCEKGKGNKAIFRGLTLFFIQSFPKGGAYVNPYLRPFLLGSARKSYFSEKCTFSRKSYFVLPENRTFQKIVLVFHFPRKSYLFSENRTIILHPLSHNGFRRFGFQKFVLIFTFLENYLHKYIQRIYILLIFVSETKMVGSSNG